MPPVRLTDEIEGQGFPECRTAVLRGEPEAVTLLGWMAEPLGVVCGEGGVTSPIWAALGTQCPHVEGRAGQTNLGAFAVDKDATAVQHGIH